MEHISTDDEHPQGLAADTRADIAAKAVLARLRAALLRHQSDFLASAGGEDLHDFRVAVRRTRSIGRFTAGFAALGQSSTPSRDWEVCRLSLDTLAADLPPSLAPGLEPLRALFGARRQQERERLAARLRSAEHGRFLDAWQRYLSRPPPQTRPGRADRPIAQVAGRRIAKLYRRIIEQGTAIAEDSPPEAFHELRKTCKKLRYVMELGLALFPAGPHARLLANLKGVQEVLGLYQDSQLQAGLLKRLAEEPPAPDLPPAAFMAPGRPGAAPGTTSRRSPHPLPAALRPPRFPQAGATRGQCLWGEIPLICPKDRRFAPQVLCCSGALRCALVAKCGLAGGGSGGERMSGSI